MSPCISSLQPAVFFFGFSPQPGALQASSSLHHWISTADGVRARGKTTPGTSSWTRPWWRSRTPKLGQLGRNQHWRSISSRPSRCGRSEVMCIYIYTRYIYIYTVYIYIFRYIYILYIYYIYSIIIYIYSIYIYIFYIYILYIYILYIYSIYILYIYIFYIYILYIYYIYILYIHIYILYIHIYILYGISPSEFVSRTFPWYISSSKDGAPWVFFFDQDIEWGTL